MESRLPSSTRPGFVRQARGVIVGEGRGEEVGVEDMVGATVADGSVGFGVACFDGEQAENPPRSRSSIATCCIA